MNIEQIKIEDWYGDINYIHKDVVYEWLEEKWNEHIHWSHYLGNKKICVNKSLEDERIIIILPRAGCR